MPRETIRDMVGCYDVQVGWTKREGGGDVQLAVEMRAPLTNESPQNLHELVHSWEKATPDIPIGDFGSMGLWSTLDREGINHLIRILRKARDQAFGRDE